VTHDQAEAFSIADKVAVLHHGILQQFDTPENLYRNPANITVANFLGFRNLVQGVISEDGTFHSPLGRLPIDEISKNVLPESAATLLIRPEGAAINLCPTSRVESLRISGQVIDRRFQGSTYRLSLLAAKIHLTFDLPINPLPPQIGQSILLFLNPSALVLMKD
jgi:ABC-type Fe3+/spermidine/putrescine transport system ATPase subunit